MSAWMTLGQIAYQAFAQHAKQERGVQMVPWAALKDDARDGWALVAKTVTEHAVAIAKHPVAVQA